MQVQGYPAEVRRLYPYRAYRVLGGGFPPERLLGPKVPWLIRSRVVGGSLIWETTLEAAELGQALKERGLGEVWVEPLPPTLEMVFTHLTHEAHG